MTRMMYRCYVEGGVGEVLVDEPLTCAKKWGGRLVGTVDGPDPPSSGWGCSAFISQSATQLGFANFDVAEVILEFGACVLKRSKRGRHFVTVWLRASRWIFPVLRVNRSIIGDFIYAYVDTAPFLRFVMDAKSVGHNNLRFPADTHRRIQKVLRGLRNGWDDPRFHESLDFLAEEFAAWKGKSPKQVRQLYINE